MGCRSEENLKEKNDEKMMNLKTGNSLLDPSDSEDGGFRVELEHRH